MTWPVAAGTGSCPATASAAAAATLCIPPHTTRACFSGCFFFPPEMSFAKTDCANDVNPVSLPTLHLSSSLFLFAVLEWRYPASAGGSSCLGKLLPSLAAGMEMKSCCRALLLQQQRGEVWFLAGLIWSVLQCQCSSWQSITSACLSAWAHKKHIHVGSTGCVQVEQVIPTGCSCQPWSR